MDFRYFFLDNYSTRPMFDPIIGCSIACPYCNAFTDGQKIGITTTWDKWIKPIYVDVDKDIAMKEYLYFKNNFTLLWDFVFVCSTSDPFQNKRAVDIYMQSIRFLNSIKLNTLCLSKGKIPIDVFTLPTNNAIGITITGYNHYLKQTQNIYTLRQLKICGYFVWVSLQPFSIDDEPYLSEILYNIGFVDKITFGPLDDELNFDPYYRMSDLIADYCICKKISFINGTKRFSKLNKQRLAIQGYSRNTINYPHLFFDSYLM